MTTDDGWPAIDYPMTPEALRQLHVWLRAVKWCRDCKAWLPIQQFYLLPQSRSLCAECHRQQQRARYARSRAA